MSCAKLCKRVQKDEIIDAILTELRRNPKLTNRELSLKLLLHRNTISKYRKYIRETYYKSPEEIVNKIDSRLGEELDTMTHTTLLTYRGQLVPKQLDIKKEVKTEHRTDINVLMEKYEQVIERTANRNLPENNPSKQVHSTHTDN